MLAAPSDAARLLREAADSVSRADAEYLLMHLLGVRRHQLFLGMAIPAWAVSRFRRLAARARLGEPVQYIVRSAPFLDFDVYVDRRVLIPRPETEELVARTLAKLEPGPNQRALDFGTGSACIAIALARAFPSMKVMAVDASRAALAVATWNISKLGLARRIRAARADSLGERTLTRMRGQLDLLIANPPYVPTSRLARLERSVRREPRLALDGGPKGANIVAMLLTCGPALLKPGGLLAIEIDATHRAIVQKLAPGVEVERDLAGRDRYAFLRK